jgi:hypothetical protein
MRALSDGGQTYPNAVRLATTCWWRAAPSSIAAGYPANLTPDPATGIGSWTDDDITTAIRTGVDDEAMILCAVMPASPISATSRFARSSAFYGSSLPSPPRSPRRRRATSR